MEEEARIYREFLRENRSVDPDQLEHDLKIARLDACELYLKKDLPDFLTLTSEAVEKKDNSEKDFEHGNAHEGIARSQTLLANGSSMERDQTGIHS
jgi:hypothetical protein